MMTPSRVGATLTLVWLLAAAATVDASSQYRNPRSVSSSSSSRRSTSRRRRSGRSIVHDDNDNHPSDGYDSHWDGGISSGYSSSPSLTDEHWEDEEASSYSDFYDFEDLQRVKKRKKRKRALVDETERLLQALEQGEAQEKRTRKRKQSSGKRRRKKQSTTTASSSASSSPLPKSSRKKKKKRKRTRKIAAPKSPGSTNLPSDLPSQNAKNIADRPLATRAFVKKASNKVGNGSPGASSSSSVARKTTTAPLKSHPDRTKWEVPSYSHKISTMMSTKKQESKISSASRAAPAATAAAAGLARTTQAAAATTPSRGVSGAGAAASRKPVAASTTTAGVRSPRVPKRTAAAATTTKAAPKSSTLGSTTTPWVRKFLAGRPKDRLLPLPRDYIADNFNLAQLPPIVERIGYQAMGDDAIPVAKALQQHRIAAASPPSKLTSYPIYRRALRSILADPSVSEESLDSDEDLIIPPYAIQKAAEALYLLLHARFVVSPRGLEAIRHVMALDNTVFGKCPRSTCKGTGLLPYGYSNDYTSDASVPTVTTASRKEHDSCCHRYCPSCGEVWISWDSKTDGCAWGPSWCHLFLLAFGSQVYAKELAAAAAAARAPPRPEPRPSSPVRSFIARGIGYPRGSTNATAGSSGRPNTPSEEEDLSRPVPSVFGFRIHPSTAFGRPLNEPSLRGGSND